MKNLSLLKYNKWIVVLSLITFVIVGGLSYASFQIGGWRLSSGEGAVTVNSDLSYCYIATNNNTSNDVFIPTNTDVEWNAFYTYPSSYINLQTYNQPECNRGNPGYCNNGEASVVDDSGDPWTWTCTTECGYAMCDYTLP